MIWPFSVTLDNRARAAPIRYPGFENIVPNLSGCMNCRPDLTHSVGPRWTGGRPDYWDTWQRFAQYSMAGHRSPYTMGLYGFAKPDGHRQWSQPCRRRPGLTQ
jgi:hypothetical protein